MADGSYVPGIAFGITGIVLVCMNIFFKSYIKKLKAKSDERNVEFENKRNEIMAERKKVADELNKNTTFTINESKIILSENDKKRIEKNCKIMAKKKLPYHSEMKLIPFDAIVKIKNKEEIAKQMVNEYCIAHKALNELVYLFERVNVYMWILGLGYKPLPNKQCFVPGLAMKISEYNNINQLISNCKMISDEEIMEYTDLMTRYEWAMIELNSKGEKSKHINNDSVTEQKKAIDWVVSFDCSALME